MILADGTYWKYDYDDLGQLILGTKHWPDGTEIAGQNFTYAFDDIGNRTQTGGRASAVSTYQTNQLNQYTQRTVAGAIDVFGLADPQATVLVNSATASRYGSYFHKVVSVDNSTSAQYLTLTIQAGNNSTTRHAFVPKNPEVFEYDDDGNLTQDGRWNYEWNGENRLVQMTTRSDVPGPHYQLTFQYDWLGRRIRKTVVNLDTGQTISDLIFLYDGWNLIAEVDVQTGELIRTYVWGLDLSGAMQGAGGISGLLWVNVESGSHAGRYFAVYDGNGNVMGLVSASAGSVAAQYEYGPFAEPLRATGPAAADNPLRFSTKYTDPETGLLYYGYRYYSPSLGRWLRRDKFIQKLVYVYNRNQSVNYIDKIGLFEIRYMGVPQWCPSSRMFWVGYFLRFDRNDLEGLPCVENVPIWLGTLLLKYSADFEAECCDETGRVSKSSEVRYYASPIAINVRGSLMPYPGSVFWYRFDDGRHYPYEHVWGAFPGLLSQAGGMECSCGMRFTLYARLEFKLVPRSPYEETTGRGHYYVWEIPPSEGWGDIYGHPPGNYFWIYQWTKNQIPSLWLRPGPSQTIEVLFEVANCSGEYKWTYLSIPDPGKPGPTRFDKPPHKGCINLLTDTKIGKNWKD